ncbi:MAG: TRAP transporter substrate-binding protein DctP [Proteobacteria bacterium]|nr:TRAP transporter substrate-binding protein DctP [Pseudomonadota bacterium]
MLNTRNVASAIAALGLVALGADLSAASGAVEVAQAPSRVYNWRMPTSLGAKDPYIVRQATMIARIKERTRGAVNITMYPSDALMKPNDVPKAVSTGTVEMDSVGMVFYGGVSDLAAILVPGFVGTSTAHALRVVQPGSEGRKILDQHFAEKNIKALAFWDQADIGFASYRPLNTVESFKGKKLRVSNEIAAEVLRALGAEPTVMGGAEAVDAMRRKIIEGSTCHPTCIISRGYLDFAESYTPWTVVPNLGWLTVNVNAWNSLPADFQKIIQEEADAAAKDQTELVATIQGQTMWTLAIEHGISLHAIRPAEAAKLRAIAKPIFDDFVKKARPQPQATRVAELLMQAAEKR